MLRLLLPLAITLAPAWASDPVRPLTPEQKALHALSRLTFGARPGDLEAVEKLGVEKWIELQLHPDQIAEDPQLETRLKPLATLRMDSAQILKDYYYPMPNRIVFQGTRLNEIITNEQQRKIYNGTAEERRAAIMALDPEKRWKVLAMVPDNVVEGMADLQKERTTARQKDQEERQKEIRRLRPQLNDLLSPDEVRTATRGTPEERSALFRSLNPEKLQKVAAALPPDALAGQAELRRAANMTRFPQQNIGADLREGKLFRAIYSRRQLEEVLTDFWFNHFNVFDGKERDVTLLASYERDAIRPHVLGKFKDLLLATARHPAMLTYLDNWQSMSTDAMQVGPFAPGPPNPFPRPSGFGGQAHGLNENYGRELLELHTLGVDGGYTQQDVINVARCFTGWTIRKPAEQPEFAYASFMHDSGEKTVLGHKTAAGGGEQDALTVIDIISRHPSTVRHISTKLARRFVADEPPAALVDRMAQTFLKTGGDLRAVMQTMLTSKEFFSEAAWQAKLKSPLELVAGAARALDANPTDTLLLVQKVAEMGQPLYGKETPNGYKETADAWLSTANVMARIDFARLIANNQIPGVSVDLARFNGRGPVAIAHELLQHDPSSQTLAAIQEATRERAAEPSLIVMLVLSSPDFQRR